MKTKLPLIIVIIAVVVLVVAAVILGGIKPPKGPEQGTGGLTDLKNVAIAEEIYGFSATIKETQDKTLILEGWIPLADENAEPIKATVKAVVDENTKIVQLKFPQEIPAGSKEPIQPEEIQMSFEELKVGDEINIGTIENISGKIKNGEEFELNDIFIIVTE